MRLVAGRRSLGIFTRKTHGSVAFRCAIAFLATACSLAVSLLLRPVTYQTPYLPYYGAVLIAVLVGGFEAGLLATSLSALAVHYYFLPPYNSLELTLWSGLQGVYFCVTFGAICWLIDRRKARMESEIRRREDDLRRAQAVASTGSWRLDVTRNELLWSDESYRIFDITPGTPLTYETFMSAVHPDDREMVNTRWQAALKGEPYDIEHRILVGDREKWVRETAELEFDAAGQLRGGFGAVQDITKRKQAELALRESESRLRTVLQTLPVGVWLTNEKGEIVFGNPAAHRIWGGARYVPIDKQGEYKGWWYETGKQLAGEDWALSRALAKGETALNELIEIECFDGQRKIIYNSGIPIRDPDGHLLGALAINEDVTERKKAEQALIRTERLASAGRLAATIAHEIRNPLEAIQSVAYLLRTSGNLPHASTEMLRVIDEESARIENIVRNTLTLHRDSRLATEFDAAGEVKLIVERYASKAAKNRVTIGTPRWTEDARLTGHPGELRQIVTNLLGNALDAVQSGGVVAVRVSSLRSRGQRVRITIADNGCGISALSRSRLFEPFFTTKDESGTGLGLWVTKQLVERSGGRIQMRSATDGPRRGTTFSIVLPTVSDVVTAGPEAQAAYTKKAATC